MVCTEKLHSIKAKKVLKNFLKSNYRIKIGNRLIVKYLF